MVTPVRDGYLILSLRARAGSVTLLAALLLTGPSAAEELRNWAPDPFERLSSQAKHCPEPRGPRMSEREWKADAHWRIETGTSCWLAGRCEDSNAYRYDARIAQRLLPKLKARWEEMDGHSVWVFVQRRIVFVQGCVKDAGQAQALEAALEAIVKDDPEVTMVVPALRVGPQGRLPYRPLQE